MPDHRWSQAAAEDDKELISEMLSRTQEASFGH
jgi:hypothetical protein